MSVVRQSCAVTDFSSSPRASAHVSLDRRPFSRGPLSCGNSERKGLDRCRITAVVGPGRGGPEAKSALFLQKHSVKCRKSADFSQIPVYQQGFELQKICIFSAVFLQSKIPSAKNLHFFCKYSAFFLQSKIPSALFLQKYLFSRPYMLSQEQIVITLSYQSSTTTACFKRRKFQRW